MADSNSKLYSLGCWELLGILKMSDSCLMLIADILLDQLSAEVAYLTVDW